MTSHIGQREQENGEQVIRKENLDRPNTKKVDGAANSYFGNLHHSGTHRSQAQAFLLHTNRQPLPSIDTREISS